MAVKDSETMPRQATIVGLGLIGGAVGIALRRGGWSVRYMDPNVSPDEAHRAGAADAQTDTLRGADIVVIATPLDVAVDLLRDLELLDHDHRVVATSVCSVMQPLRAVARGTFVAGHPMAGWHEGGLANAQHVNLTGTRWFLDGGDDRIEQLVRDCGAIPVPIDAIYHDAAMALTSHLPQVLSTALLAYLSDQPGVAELAGGGLRSFRLAADDGAMWHSVLAANREALRPHADAIATLVKAIIEGDDPGAFARARKLWQELQG